MKGMKSISMMICIRARMSIECVVKHLHLTLVNLVNLDLPGV